MTTVRLLLLWPYVSFLFAGERTLAALTYIIAVVTDIDGTIARRMGTTSTFGAFYDPFVDGLFMVVALALLASSGDVLLIPLLVYWASLLLRLIPSLRYFARKHQVRSTLLTKAIAFTGFTTVLLGTLRAPQLLTTSILLTGAVANVVVVSYWAWQART